MLYEVITIAQVTVLVELRTFQAQFKYVMMGIGVIFRTPIPTDQEMTSDKIAPDGERIHDLRSVYDFVETEQAPHAAHHGVTEIRVQELIGARAGDNLDRITSYNVCYTKLLRRKRRSRFSERQRPEISSSSA